MCACVCEFCVILRKVLFGAPCFGLSVCDIKGPGSQLVWSCSLLRLLSSLPFTLTVCLPSDDTCLPRVTLTNPPHFFLHAPPSFSPTAARPLNPISATKKSAAVPPVTTAAIKPAPAAKVCGTSAIPSKHVRKKVNFETTCMRHAVRGTSNAF